MVNFNFKASIFILLIPSLITKTNFAFAQKLPSCSTISAYARCITACDEKAKKDPDCVRCKTIYGYSCCTTGQDCYKECSSTYECKFP